MADRNVSHPHQGRYGSAKGRGDERGPVPQVSVRTRFPTE